jgi:hypothetical protein
MSNRLVRKYFKCHKCKDIESQLIHPNKFQIKCQSCGVFLNEISEKEFKALKKSKNPNNEHKTNNDAPYMPSENAFRNISSVYNRPPSRTNNQNHNQNSNNINFNNRNRFNNINNNNGQQQRNRRYQSTDHYTDMNIVNDNNNNNYFMNNMNNINSINNRNNNNFNNINNNSRSNQFRESQNRFNHNTGQNGSNNQNEDERTRNYGQGARNRERSQDPMNSSFYNNFFNLFGLMGMGVPIIISSSGQGQPFRIYVQRQNVPQSIFDPMFLSFGSMFNNDFRDNFSSNFRSNFRGDFLSEIIRIIERNQEEAARRAHPPASESALKKLKRFPLTDKYCKKDKNGKIELPSCCICLSDIEKNEETVLLPCGHMFHWNCCLNWLKGNNTCPMCRFVIKD